jgi:hypothetical protein
MTASVLRKSRVMMLSMGLTDEPDANGFQD